VAQDCAAGVSGEELDNVEKNQLPKVTGQKENFSKRPRIAQSGKQREGLPIKKKAGRHLLRKKKQRRKKNKEGYGANALPPDEKNWALQASLRASKILPAGAKPGSGQTGK